MASFYVEPLFIYLFGGQAEDFSVSLFPSVGIKMFVIYFLYVALFVTF
jgi:hypothetical protein